jgi:NADH-quinone oxidoreductase subunit C
VVAVTAGEVAGGAAVRAGPLVTRTVERLAALGGEAGEFHGQVTVTVPAESVTTAVESAKTAGFDLLSDVFGIDWLNYPRHHGPRFSVLYNLYGIEANERVFLRVDLGEGTALPTITHLWPAANFMEREVYDMFGVVFTGHPNLRKLHTPEDLEGHPHRKDFPLGETPTLFNDGRFLDPTAFRAGIVGASRGLTGWVGGARKGVVSDQPIEAPTEEPSEGSR